MTTEPSLLALDPHAHLTRLIARLDMNDARAAADRAVFGVGLPFTTAEIDGKLVGLSAKGTFDDRGRGVFALGHDFWSMAARLPKDDR